MLLADVQSNGSLRAGVLSGKGFDAGTLRCGGGERNPHASAGKYNFRGRPAQL